MVSKSTTPGGKAAFGDKKETVSGKENAKEIETSGKGIKPASIKVADIAETQALIDRIKNLQRLPQRSAKAEAEMVSLTKRLKALAKRDKNALKYFRQGKEGSVFIARYLSVCRKCRKAVDIGETAIYINSAIICSKCGIG